MTKEEKRDVYQEVTERIIELIESGEATGDWLKPWAAAVGDGIPVNATTHNHYRGVNVLMLWAVAVTRSYATNEWASYRQWKAKGAQVQGKPDDWPEHEHYGTPIVFAKEVYRRLRDGDDPSASDVVQTEHGPRKRIRMMRFSTVFNADQVDGYEPDTGEEVDALDRVQEADRYVAATGATIKWGESQAAYVAPPADVILMPRASRFNGNTEGFYSALFHELTHWTGIESRLDRPMGTKEQREKYAAEELVAELGAAFQCARLGLTPVARPDHAEYVAHWVSHMRDDNRAIVRAAAQATDATNYLFELAGEPVGGKEE